MKKASNLFIYILVLTLFFAGCTSDKNHNEESKEYSLKPYHFSNAIKNPKFTVKAYDNAFELNMSFIKNGKLVNKIRLYKMKGDIYFEQKLLKHFDSERIDTIDVPYFMKKDTSFKYVFDIEKFEPNAPPGWDDWNFTLKRETDFYKLSKRHLSDSTFKEEYYFDKYFRFKGIKIVENRDTLMFGAFDK